MCGILQLQLGALESTIYVVLYTSKNIHMVEITTILLNQLDIVPNSDPHGLLGHGTLKKVMQLCSVCLIKIKAFHELIIPI